MLTNPTACLPADDNSYCLNCDTWLGLPGFHVTDVAQGGDGLYVSIETTPSQPPECRRCGHRTYGHGRIPVTVHDRPATFGKMILTWLKRRYRCQECHATFSEYQHRISRQGVLTRRAVDWAVAQLRYEHASINGLARQLGCDWHTLWPQVEARLTHAAARPERLDGVTDLGVDEHIWHHSPRKGKGPKELTGMVDLTRDEQGHVHARLLDLVPGRSGPVYADWLKAQSSEFRDGIKVATLDPFRGYKNAIDDELEDAVAAVDHFHVIKLVTTMIDDTRRRIQQETVGRRGRKDDPLYKIRNVLRVDPARLSTRQWERLNTGLDAHDDHVNVTIAWMMGCKVREAMRHENRDQGKKDLLSTIRVMLSCPVTEVARLGRTLKVWKKELEGFFDTDGANNGGTEAINGLIELHRRIARGFRNRDNYRLRMLLIGGGLDPR